LIAALAVLTLSASDTKVQANHLDGADYIGIDVDPTGNSPAVLGTRDDCISVSAGAQVPVDVTISQIAPADPMLGLNFRMSYDLDNLSVIAADYDDASLIGFNAGSTPFAAGGDESALPDVDGDYFASVADTALPVTAHESGSGVLESLVVEVSSGAPDGVYQLWLFDAVHVSRTDGLGKPAKDYLPAQIAVGMSCVGLPAPEIPPAIMGDVDCSGGVNAIDSLKLLRFNASLSVIYVGNPCTKINYLTPHNGDVDCSGVVNSIDALKILRHNALLTVPQTEPCDNIGT
jgi:hypothetical protein